MFDFQSLFDSFFGGPLGDLFALFNPIILLIEAIFGFLSALGGA